MVLSKLFICYILCIMHFEFINYKFDVFDLYKYTNLTWKLELIIKYWNILPEILSK